MQVKTDDYVQELKAKWDDINGITAISIYTKNGTFLEVGKGAKNHYEQIYKFDE
jgi:hypothetical protein